MKSPALYLRLLSYVKPYINAFAAAIICVILLAFTEPVIPYLMQPLIDDGFSGKNPRIWYLVPAAIVILYTLRAILVFAGRYMMAWVAQKVVMDMRNRIMDKLLNLPQNFFNRNKTGELISKISYNVAQVAETSTDVLVILVRDGLTVLGLVVFLIYVNWKLSLFILLIVPFIALLLKIVSARMRRLSHTTQDNMGTMTHIMEEVINGSRVIKIFSGQDYEKNRFSRISNKIRRFILKTVSASALSISILHLVNALAVSLVIMFALHEAGRGDLTSGEFVSFITALGLLWSPIKRIAEINEKLQRGLAAADSVFDLIDEEEEVDRGTVSNLERQGDIEFNNITFYYPGKSTPALRNMSFKVKAGQTVALVGRSGSGKSSIANLLPRFYKPRNGTITIGGVDINRIKLDVLRQNISFVSQDIVLFNDTVKSNIAYGSLGKASGEDIRKSADDALATDFVLQLEDGFNANIGSNGVLLSGGQRQRLAIARALLKPSPILIMDEATSALDQVLEKKIQAVLKQRKTGQTGIIITHRLAAINNVDKIFVLENGEIVEEGRHEELMDLDGLYASMVKAGDKNSPS